MEQIVIMTFWGIVLACVMFSTVVSIITVVKWSGGKSLKSKKIDKEEK